MKFGMFFVGEYLAYHSDLVDDNGVTVLRRLARSMAASDRVVRDQDVCFHLFLYSAAGVAPKVAFRSAHVLGWTMLPLVLLSICW